MVMDVQIDLTIVQKHLASEMEVAVGDVDVRLGRPWFLSKEQ